MDNVFKFKFKWPDLWDSVCDLYVTHRPSRRADIIITDPRLPPLLSISLNEWVVDPAEHFYYVWLQVMIFPIVYNWVIIILRYKHGEHQVLITHPST